MRSGAIGRPAILRPRRVSGCSRSIKIGTARQHGGRRGRRHPGDQPKSCGRPFANSRRESRPERDTRSRRTRKRDHSVDRSEAQGYSICRIQARPNRRDGRGYRSAVEQLVAQMLNLRCATSRADHKCAVLAARPAPPTSATLELFEIERRAGPYHEALARSCRKRTDAAVRLSNDELNRAKSACWRIERAYRECNAEVRRTRTNMCGLPRERTTDPRDGVRIPDWRPCSTVRPKKWRRWRRILTDENASCRVAPRRKTRRPPSAEMRAHHRPASAAPAIPEGAPEGRALAKISRRRRVTALARRRSARPC